MGNRWSGPGPSLLRPPGPNTLPPWLSPPRASRQESATQTSSSDQSSSTSNPIASPPAPIAEPAAASPVPPAPRLAPSSIQLNDVPSDLPSRPNNIDQSEGARGQERMTTPDGHQDLHESAPGSGPFGHHPNQLTIVILNHLPRDETAANDSIGGGGASEQTPQSASDSHQDGDGSGPTPGAAPTSPLPFGPGLVVAWGLEPPPGHESNGDSEQGGNPLLPLGRPPVAQPGGGANPDIPAGDALMDTTPNAVPPPTRPVAAPMPQRPPPIMFAFDPMFSAGLNPFAPPEDVDYVRSNQPWHPPTASKPLERWLLQRERELGIVCDDAHCRYLEPECVMQDLKKSQADRAKEPQEQNVVYVKAFEAHDKLCHHKFHFSCLKEANVPTGWYHELDQQGSRAVLRCPTCRAYGWTDVPMAHWKPEVEATNHPQASVSAV